MTVKLLCLDPAQMVDERLKLGRCTALFSATLSPPSYYKAVLGCDSDEQTHSYALPSPFVQEKLCLLVCNQINTRWAMREQSLEPIARLLFEMVSAKAGNYIAYFPPISICKRRQKYFPNFIHSCRWSCNRRRRTIFLRSLTSRTPNARCWALLYWAVSTPKGWICREKSC